MVHSDNLANFAEFRFYREAEDGDTVWVGEELELVVARAGKTQGKVITVIFTLLLAVALVMMGSDIDINIVRDTLKV